MTPNDLDWLSQALDALDNPSLECERPAQPLSAAASPRPVPAHWGEAAKKWRVEIAEWLVEEERQEEERKANRRAQYMSGIVKAKEKKRKGDRERQARRRDKLAEAQGRTINRRRNLKNMTPEQLVAYKRNQWKEKKRRQCGTSRPASHPLFGKF